MHIINNKEDRFLFVDAISRFDVHDHLCLIYETREEQFAAAVPFIRVGLERGEKCIYIADENSAEDVLKALRLEIDIESATKSGALVILTKRDAYLKEGYFDPDLMIELLKDAVATAKAEGFSALRATGEMTWALGREAGVDRLIEYEAKLNYFFPEYDALAICQYNRTRFSPDIILNVIKTHPTVIYGREICDNFYYVPPDELLGSGQASHEVDRLLRNINERRLTEKQRKLTNAYNRSLIEASLDPLVTIDAQGKITDVNSATEKVTGLTRTELVGTDFSDYFTEPGKARTGYGQVFQDGYVRDYELEVRHKDGHTTPVLYNASVYRDDNGVVSGVFAAARDITEQKKAEQAIRILNSELERRVVERTAQLMAANRELEAFCYSVSHDLRTPLRSIDGFSQAVLEDYEDKLDDQGKDFLCRVRAATQRMGQLIDDLLKLSRVTRGEMRWERVDLSTLIRNVAYALREAYPGRHVELLVQDDLFVNGDPQLLRVVMENLIGNAWKFTSRHQSAKIEVGTTVREGRQAYFVRDDGAGFDMAYADKLFGPFQRLHAALDFPGTGIGLATVQRIIMRHGGVIWAEGAVENGATFYFTVGQDVPAELKEAA